MDSYIAGFIFKEWPARPAFLIALGVIVAFGGIIQAQSLEERFTCEAPSAWKKYRERAWHLQGRHFHSLHHSLAGSEDVSTQRQTNQKGCQILIATQRIREADKETYAETAWVKNMDYMFRLRKNSPNSAWALVDTFLPTTDAELAQRQLKFLQLNDKLACQLLWASNYYLGDLIDDPGFRLDRCEEVVHRGVNVVKVLFTYTPANAAEGERARSLRGGYVLLDPKCHWSLRGYKLLLKSSAGDAVEQMDVLDMDVVEDGIPLSYTFSSERVGVFQGETFKVSATSRCDFQFPQEDAPESQFMLSAFGLPEPWDLQQAAKKPTRWFLWLTLAGVAFLAVGAFFYYRARRRA